MTVRPTVDEVLATTPTVRRGLDLSRPVARELIEQCLALALHAPNGANRQAWRFVVIDDPLLRAGVAHYYRAASRQYTAAPPASLSARSVSAVRHLADHLHQVPVLVLACLRGRLDGGESLARQSGFFGSAYPALWSFMLAARSRGLGTALTTVHLAYEREVAALLGVPAESVTQIALVAVGHLKDGAARRSPPRLPLHEVMSWNGWPG